MRDLLEELSEIYEKERAKVKAQRWGTGFYRNRMRMGTGVAVSIPRSCVFLKRWEERNASIG
jgi:hypothetical protein